MKLHLANRIAPRWDAAVCGVTSNCGVTSWAILFAISHTMPGLYELKSLVAAKLVINMKCSYMYFDIKEKDNFHLIVDLNTEYC